MATTMADCSTQNPKGPANIITCIASITGQTPDDYWNTVLFNKAATLDGYCKTKATYSEAEGALWDVACKSQQGTYFSYANFIAADTSFANTLGTNYSFMRNASFDVNVKELGDFLATVSQETTGNNASTGTPYTDDGLYFRFEAGALSPSACIAYSPVNPNFVNTQAGWGSGCATATLATFYSGYYPSSEFVVARSSATGDTDLYYTGYVIDSDKMYRTDLALPAITAAPKPGILGGTAATPFLPTDTTKSLTDYQWVFMNTALDPGYWVGSGPMQLTGDSVFKFFGWYHQQGKLSATSTSSTVTPVAKANFKTFVTSVLTDGVLGWQGALWYWNYRINADTYPTAHSMVSSSTKAACHDIAIATLAVNGGCNNTTQRTSYYKHFMGLWGYSTTGISFTYNGVSGDSMTCSPTLYDYCTH